MFLLKTIAQKGQTEVARLFIETGADIEEGHPLRKAAGHGHLETATLLIEDGEDVNQGYHLHAAA